MTKFVLILLSCMLVGGMADGASNTTCVCDDWTVSKQMGSTGGGLMFMLGFFACAIIAAIIFAVLTQMYPGFGSSSNKMKERQQQYYQPIPMNPYQQPFPMTPYAFKDAAGNEALPGRVLGTYLSVNENNTIEARPLVWQP